MVSGVYLRFTMGNDHWCSNMINVVVLRRSIKDLVVNQAINGGKVKKSAAIWDVLVS